MSEETAIIPKTEGRALARPSSSQGLRVFPQIKTPAQAQIITALAEHYQEPPALMLQNVFWVTSKEGGASYGFKAQFIADRVKRSGRYRFKVKKSTKEGAEIEFLEKVDGKWESCGIPATYTAEDAKAAGDLHKQAYRTHLADMLYWRCFTRGARRYCADALGGPCYTPDELDSSYSLDPDGTPVRAKEIEDVEVEKADTITVDLETVRRLVAQKRPDLGSMLSHYGVEKLEDLSSEALLNAYGILSARPDPLDVPAV